MKRLNWDCELGGVMKPKDFYEWPEESFEDRVKREKAMSVWERPSMLKALYPNSFSPFKEHLPAMRIMF